MTKKIKTLARKIDEAYDAGDTHALTQLIQECERLLDKSCVHKVAIWFLISNCHAGKAQEEQMRKGSRWSWKQDHLVRQVLSLRRAVVEPSFNLADKVLRCKILTNLANVLNSLGRPIEAIKYWDQTLEICPIFAMALGNKGYGITTYADSVYDHGHAALLISKANEELIKLESGKSLWDSGPQPQAQEFFSSIARDNEARLEAISFDHNLDLDAFSLGKTKGEKVYRRWCLDNRLFLSPLNDVVNASVAASDVIHLPNHTYDVSEHPRFPDYYNLLKQEYVSARFMLYEAVQRKPHFANKDVLLLDGLDAASYGLRTEQLKTSFRVSYSLLDKVAVFLNDYYSVGLEVRQIRFKSIWGKKNKSNETQLYPSFANSENWMLRGLYYLSKDFYDPDFQDVSSPDARELDHTRNLIEHRFLTLQHYSFECRGTEYHSYLTLDEFEGKALKMLRAAREALIYLSLAMHREEMRRSNLDPQSLLVPIISFPVHERN